MCHSIQVLSEYITYYTYSDVLLSMAMQCAWYETRKKKNIQTIWITQQRCFLILSSPSIVQYAKQLSNVCIGFIWTAFIQIWFFFLLCREEEKNGSHCNTIVENEWMNECGRKTRRKMATAENKSLMHSIKTCTYGLWFTCDVQMILLDFQFVYLYHKQSRRFVCCPRNWIL